MPITKDDFLKIIDKEVELEFGPTKLSGKVVDCNDTHLTMLSGTKEGTILLSAILSFKEI